MKQPVLAHVNCPDAQLGHRMAYVQWGDALAPHVVLCVHGLTRQGRDFDTLAQALVAAARQPIRVICPDVVGRGLSDWLSDPTAYQIPQYVSDMAALLAHLHAQAPVHTLDWVGTSMGGLIGMALAALPESPITRLVLNDVGPLVTAVSLERIATYVGKAPRLPSIEAAEMLVRTVSAPFGLHTDAEWRFLTEHVVRREADGSYRMHYDPAIAVPFRAVTPQLAQAGEAQHGGIGPRVGGNDHRDELGASAALARGPRQRGPETSHQETGTGDLNCEHSLPICCLSGGTVG